ncbi:hypothetical protein EXU57_04215 [Segetibacter sp. 3557_3]|uniref:hypothetical protein n=1 Tax=Segetibacter sp. 3557_3 TaxID=2547429 RepID=UPI0010587C50|nr:hypothetical protein [Segetibacter sp. 3557_3]TDH29274.1 hypothetical protein EXU57_04215 [Segetibacter sp. 3557_3]
MKRVSTIVLVIVAIVVLQSCSRHNGANSQAAQASLFGTWTLSESSGGMRPGVAKHPPGNGNNLKFTETDFEMYEAGQLVKSGKYTVVADTTVEASVCMVLPKGEFTKRIIYNNDTTADKVFFKIEAEKLTFISGCYAYDAGHQETYVKQKTGR